VWKRCNQLPGKLWAIAGVASVLHLLGQVQVLNAGLQQPAQLGCSSLRSWLQVQNNAPADPCSNSLGSRWAVSTSSVSWDRKRMRGDCWPAGSAAAGPACSTDKQQYPQAGQS
jgi:hypothetical protein